MHVDRNALIEHILSRYAVDAEQPWPETPESLVFRRPDNQKWFAIAMTIPSVKLVSGSEGMIDIINLKCDPILIGSLRLKPGYYPAWHMNKQHWISVALNALVPDEELISLIDLSHELAGPMRKQRTEDKT